METKHITLDSFEYNGKEYYAEGTVSYYLTIESGDYEVPSSSEIDIEGLEIEVLKVYRPQFNDWVECYQPSIIKAVTEEIKSNFEL